MSERKMPDDVKWTAREAMACAYCWAEFANPETRGDSPEAYWLRIAERARNECRTIANKRLLLAVARGEASAILPAASYAKEDIEAVGAAMGLKLHHRIERAINAVCRTLKPRTPFDA